MGIPQIILIVLYAVSLLLNAYIHGKPKEGYNNFWIALISTGIDIGLLLWGGFLANCKSNRGEI